MHAVIVHQKNDEKKNSHQLNPTTHDSNDKTSLRETIIFFLFQSLIVTILSFITIYIICNMVHPQVEQAVTAVDSFMAKYPTITQYGRFKVEFAFCVLLFLAVPFLRDFLRQQKV